MADEESAILMSSLVSHCLCYVKHISSYKYLHSHLDSTIS